MNSKSDRPHVIRWFKFVSALALSAGAAYALSFAVDILVGVLMHVYPATASAAVVTWSAIAVVLSLVSLLLAKGNRWASIPYVIFGIVAVIGGFVAAHPRDFIVAGALFVQMFAVWCATKPSVPRPEVVVDSRRHRSITGFKDGSNT